MQPSNLHKISIPNVSIFNRSNIFLFSIMQYQVFESEVDQWQYVYIKLIYYFYILLGKLKQKNA